MPIAQRVACDGDALAKSDGCVGEVQADGMVGEGFCDDGDTTEEKPGMNCGAGKDNEYPEGGEVDEEGVKGQLLVTGEEKEKRPEDDKDEPIRKTVC